MNPNPSDTPSGSEGLGTDICCSQAGVPDAYLLPICHCPCHRPEPSPGTEKEKEMTRTGDYSIGNDNWPGLSKLIEECGEVLQVAGKLIATGGHK